MVEDSGSVLTAVPPFNPQTICYRLAEDHEGPVLGDLFRRSGGNDWGADWTRGVYPYWMVTDTVPIVGAVCVMPGKPFGRVEYLLTDPELPLRWKAIIVRDLCYAGLHLLKRHGGQFALSQIENAHATFLPAILKRGAVELVTEGPTIIKKV